MQQDEHGQGWLDRERLTVYPRIIVTLYVVLGGWWVLGSHRLVDRAGKPIGADFVTFWGAARLAAGGHPAAVYDVVALHTAEQAAVGGQIARFAWHYPPTFLLLVRPLALLPYGLAIALWTLAGLIAYVAWARRADDRGIVLGLALAFPGLFLCLGQGQNGVLSLLLLAALWGVPRRPVAGGFALGLLTYKPQIAPIVGVVLLAGRRFRTLLAMVASAALFAGLTVILWGTAPWAAFFANLPRAGAILLNGALPLGKMPTLAASLTLLGAPAAVTRVLQGLLALGTAAAVGWMAWRRAPWPLVASAAVVGALLATPFAFDYDQVVLALPLLALGQWAEQHGWRPGEKAVLVLGWLAPAITDLVGLGIGLQVGPVVHAALLYALLRRGLDAAP